MKEVIELNLNEEIFQLKRECNSLNYLLKKRSELETEINNLDHALVGLHSPTFDNLNKGSCTTTKTDLITKKNELEEEHRIITLRISKINNFLSKIDDELDRNFLVDSWIKGTPFRKMAYKYQYSNSQVYRKLYAIAKKVIVES